MDWKENENKLKKTFELGGFSEIIDLLPRLAKIADDLKHHPDFKVHD